MNEINTSGMNVIMDVEREGTTSISARTYYELMRVEETKGVDDESRKILVGSIGVLETQIGKEIPNRMPGVRVPVRSRHTIRQAQLDHQLVEEIKQPLGAVAERMAFNAVENSEKYSSVDPRTGLPGRGELSKFMLWLAENGIAQVSLTVCDANKLKRANDNMGSEKAGDLVILTTAFGLEAYFDQKYEGSVTFNIGGDEFVVVTLGDIKETAREITDGVNLTISREVPNFPSFVGKDKIFGHELVFVKEKADKRVSQEEMREWQRRATEKGDQKLIDDPISVACAARVIDLQIEIAESGTEGERVENIFREIDECKIEITNLKRSMGDLGKRIIS